MNAHVILLCQGQQSRLPDLRIQKHLLRLPACNDVPIVYRTLCQLALMGLEGITVICEGLLKYALDVGGKDLVRCQTGRAISLLTHELPDPGNSSLKGLARYLDTQLDRGVVSLDPLLQTVVLFGDAIYSWDCLRSIVSLPSTWQMRFVGSPDLSRSSGELWGASWRTGAPQVHDLVMRCLDDALARHPPFETYQCGQLRRWLWSVNESIDGKNWEAIEATNAPTWFTSVGDFTRDIDLPEHAAQLGALSALARDDDSANGLVWTDGVDKW